MPSVVNISGHAHVHLAHSGGGERLNSPRTNAHTTMVRLGRCQGDGTHSQDCDHATGLLEQLRNVLGNVPITL